MAQADLGIEVIDRILTRDFLESIGMEEYGRSVEGVVRIVNDNGVYQIDYEQKSKGRGAYVCKCADCIKNAFFKGGMDRSFRCSIPKEVANSLSEKLVKDIDGET